MIQLRIILRICSLALCAAAFLPLSFSVRPSFGADRLRMFYSAITGEQSAFYIIRESGMFQKYGLDPEIIFLDSGTIAVQAMLSGEIQLGLTGATAAITSNLHGSDIKIIAGMINSLTYILMSDPKITRPEQLKGGKIAISRFGSLSDFGARLALKAGVPTSPDTLLRSCIPWSTSTASVVHGCWVLTTWPCDAKDVTCDQVLECSLGIAGCLDFRIAACRA